MGDQGEIVMLEVGDRLSGPMLDSSLALKAPALPVPCEGHETRPTQPGETRFWCSCDPGRLHPFGSSADLVRHVTQARARQTDHGSGAVLNTGRRT
jgi:hypothetical protein